MRKRIRDEMHTTFATQYAATIRLADLLEPETLLSITRKSTSNKHLVNPSI
jgi:hypothetical protein